MLTFSVESLLHVSLTLVLLLISLTAVDQRPNFKLELISSNNVILDSYVGLSITLLRVLGA